MKQQIHITKTLLAAALGLLLATPALAQTLFINEILASNTATYSDPAGDFDDWVEVYNPGNTNIDLAGMFFTDDLADPTKWQVPSGSPGSTTVNAGGYLLFWFDSEPLEGPTHATFKLSASGESLALYASDGTTAIDAITFSQQSTDVSFGRQPDGGTVWKYFTDPTPWAANNTSGSGGFVQLEAFSPAPGFYSGATSVAISSSTSGATIHYTLDGTVPTTASAVYTGPLSISATTPLRARAFKNGLLPSAIETGTYFFGVSHDIAVVSLTTAPHNLFDENYGIYTRGPITESDYPHFDANYFQDWERDVHFEFYQPSGSFGFKFDAGIKIFGGWSRARAQKSVAIHLRGQYGDSSVDYPIFPGEPVTKFKSFVLRNSGNDWNRLHYRDAIMHSLIRDFSDIPILQDSPVLGLGYRPTAVYINGQYWGIKNLREKTNEDYLAGRFGIDPDNVDLLQFEARGNLVANEGDTLNYAAMTDFIKANPLSNHPSYDVVAEWMDVPEYIDYFAANIFYGNGDWPGNNIKFWREKEAGKKWHWIMYDTDFGIGIYGRHEENSLANALEPAGPAWPNPPHSTFLFRSLIENDSFRHDFINRSADFMNVAFTPARINGRMEQLGSAIATEIPNQLARWGGPTNWEAEKQKVRDFNTLRIPAVQSHFLAQFPEVTGTATFSVAAAPAAWGTVKLSTVTPDLSAGSWTGTYFTGVPVPLKAIPNRGYRFLEWTDASLGTLENASKVISSAYGVTARFAKGSTSTAGIVINEINYNSPDQPNAGDWIELYNPTGGDVWLTGMYFQDESGAYYPIPKGVTIKSGQYLVIAEDLDEFQAAHPSVANVIGGFGGVDGFKLSNSGERVELLNANHVVLDRVTYSDGGAWPVSPDGDGPTLSLIRFDLDNALGSSWAASNEAGGTPGRENFMGVWAEMKIALQGAYNGSAMNTGLTLPMAQPFSGSPWNYNGVEQMDTVPDGAVDWVLLELRTSRQGPAVAQRAALVRSDGTVMGMDGSPAVNFSGMSNGNYYVVVRHRNHLAVVSTTPVSLTR